MSDDLPNMSAGLPIQKEVLAASLAAGTNIKDAALLAISAQTGYRWAAESDFKARVKELQAALKAAMYSTLRTAARSPWTWRAPRRQPLSLATIAWVRLLRLDEQAMEAKDLETLENIHRQVVAHLGGNEEEDPADVAQWVLNRIHLGRVLLQDKNMQMIENAEGLGGQASIGRGGLVRRTEMREDYEPEFS